MYVPRGGGETRGECRPTSELTLDNAGGGKHWECLSLCNVGNVLQCEGKISGAMQQLALARGDNTHPGRTVPFHRTWQIHIFKQLAKSVSLTVRPGCGTNFKQLTGGGRESAPVLPSETRPRILGACPRHQTRKQTRTQNKRNKRDLKTSAEPNFCGISSIENLVV